MSSFGYAGQQNAFNSLMQNAYGGLAQQQCHQMQQYAQIQQAAQIHSNTVSTPKTKETKVKDEILPDISLTRVFKWAIVLLLALGLGKKVWATFGPKIEAQLHKALELK